MYIIYNIRYVLSRYILSRSHLNVNINLYYFQFAV